MKDQQLTFSDISSFQRVKALTRNQRKIITLVSMELTQAGIARKLGLSRPYVNRVIKRLESLNLIKRIDTQHQPDKRNYNLFYEVSPEIKIPGATFTPFRAHHFIRKYQIIRQASPLSLDERTGYQKSKNMRGGPRHKYWYPGKAGLPSVTIEAHPKTLMVWIDKGQTIAARTEQEARELGWYAIQQARDLFLSQQRHFGIDLELETVGKQVGKVHMGLIGNEDGVMAPIKTRQDMIPQEQIMARPHPVWFDKSVEKELGPGFIEMEMFDDHPALFPAEQTIQAIAELPATIRAAMPEAMRDFNDKLNPMATSIDQVKAMLQGGIGISAQYEQMVNLLTKVLNDMHEIRDENRQLKEKFNQLDV